MPARHFLQMTVRAWLGRNLDHGGAGGGTQDAIGARVGVLALPGLEGWRSSGRMVGMWPARPPDQSHCHQQEMQVRLPSFFS